MLVGCARKKSHERAEAGIGFVLLGPWCAGPSAGEEMDLGLLVACFGLDFVAQKKRPMGLGFGPNKIENNN